MGHRHEIRLFVSSERCEVSLTPDQEIVLRRSDAPQEIVLPDPSVSRDTGHVARLRVVDDQIVLDPADAPNPILVNGVKVVGPKPLRVGDRIRVGYSVIVVQEILDSDCHGDRQFETISLGTSYVQQRNVLGSEADRLAQWSEGFDQMKAASDEREAAEVILEQLVRSLLGDRVLLALGHASSTSVCCRELASCGLSSGEIEQLLRWFNDNQPSPGAMTPTVSEVWGSHSRKRVAIGRLDVEDELWLVYVERSASVETIQVAHRAMSIMSNMLQLYKMFHEQRVGQQLVDQLSHTVRVYARPPEQVNCEIVESKFVFRSDVMRDLCRLLAHAAAAPSPVLLMGEPGTGKQLAAEALHAASSRRHLDMVSVSLSEYPEGLIESALFGQVKGAFTGAMEREGLIAHANGSSLFVDEIGELLPSIQAKLLRVLERGEFRRLGELKLTDVDIRIITATNRNLPEEVRRNSFRPDLYARISVIPIIIPPLREHVDDIPLLAQHFLGKSNEAMAKDVFIRDDGIRHLKRYSWPDNVRGLKNYIERTVAFADFGSQSLGPDDMPLFAPRPPVSAPTTVIDNLVQQLRDEGRIKQATVLSAFSETSERRGKEVWAKQIGISRPVFRSELQKLIAYSLERGVPLKFFESRVKLRPEDWDKIRTLRDTSEH